MSEADDIVAKVDARGVATLSFNRPERGNAYGSSLLASMRKHLQDFRDSEHVRVVVLRGEGKHFCVGADLKAPSSVGLVDVCLALDTLNKPTIAIVQGACIGGGVAFAACCDIVLADRAAFFSIPEVRIGLAAGPLSPFMLRAMGARQLRRYGLSGERFSAEEAHRIGLVHTLTDAVGGEHGAQAARSVIDACLLGAPGAIAEFKSTIERVEHADVTPELLTALQERFNARRGSDEAVEGVASFKEKRAPRWAPVPTEPSRDPS